MRKGVHLREHKGVSFIMGTIEGNKVQHSVDTLKTCAAYYDDLEDLSERCSRNMSVKRNLDKILK